MSETRSPTSNTGSWHDPDNAHTDDLNYAYCGSGEGGYTHDYNGYGFSAIGNIVEVRVDVKGYSGDGTKHTVNVYVWDGSQWSLIGTITSGTQCNAHQFDATGYIDTVAKLNAIKTRVESVGLSGGAPGSRYVRVCWIPVYGEWTLGPTETITAMEFPMSYLENGAEELRSKVSGATVDIVAMDFPEVLVKKGKVNELRSKF